MTLSRLSAQRWRISLALGAFVMFAYFSFILLVAFNKRAVATLVAPGLSLGILLGALVIALSWMATWIYVRWANDHYDRRVQELRVGRSKP
jgi:uncharacterized membrane protein (DUF485 family)